MKKFGVIIAIIAALAVFAGCGTSGGSGAAAGGATLEPIEVDLSKLPAVRNTKPFAKQYDDFFIRMPNLGINFNQYPRVLITVKYFNAAGQEIEQGDDNIMVVFVVDPDGDWRGPAMGPGPNTPLKEFSLGGFECRLKAGRGVRHGLGNRQLGGILFQNLRTQVAFVELTSLTFMP